MEDSISRVPTMQCRLVAHHVEEQRRVGALHCMVQVCIGADDARGLAAQLQGDRLDPVSCLLHDELADLCAACEGALQSMEEKLGLSVC